MKYQDLYNQGRLTSGQEAIDFYTQSLKLYDGSDNLAWLYRAMELNGLERYEEAIKDAEAYIGIKPNPSRFMGWFQKGLGLSGLERYQEALEAFNKAIELNPGFAEFYLGRMVAKNGLGLPYADDIELAKYYS